MQAFDADTIVLGAGTMGAAAALSLARAGRRVIAIDRFSPPHSNGEHHGERRMFRTAYYEHPDYVPLLRRAFAGWKQLERECGRTLFEVTGAVYAGARTGEVVPGSLRAAKAHGIPHLELNRTQLLKIFPGASLPPDAIGLAEEPAGFLHCEAAIAEMLRLARSHGATLHTSDPVESWSIEAGRVEVRTRRRRFHARSLVIASGPWSVPLLRELGVQLTVTRQLQAWAMSPIAVMHRCWAIERPDRSLLYGFPFDPGACEMKFGIHARGEPIDPDASTPDATFDELDELRAALVAMFPALSATGLRTTVCRYTNSPDSHFIIDRHPAHSNVVIAAGFSGHGFKFAPAVGDMIAQLLEHGTHPAPFLGLSRFKEQP